MGIFQREESERLNNLRAKAVKAAGEACIDWVIDTGSCMFCQLYAMTRQHLDECPLREYFLEFGRARGRKVST